MAERRVFLEAAHEAEHLRIILTPQSKVLLELNNSQTEFETLEDAYEFGWVRRMFERVVPGVRKRTRACGWRRADVILSKPSVQALGFDHV